jgi:Uri superfamily endonuclease
MKEDRSPRSSNALAESLPPNPGTYALLLRPQQHIVLEVGRLGTFRLPAGLYVYVGSARGPGGIRARVNRHLRDSKRAHWHIDAFTHVCSVEGLCWVLDAGRLECAWVQALLELAGSLTPIPGFGSSDCPSGCTAHLVQMAGTARVSEVERTMVLRMPLLFSIVAGSGLLKNQVHTDSMLFP